MRVPFKNTVHEPNLLSQKIVLILARFPLWIKARTLTFPQRKLLSAIPLFHTVLQGPSRAGLQLQIL